MVTVGLGPGGWALSGGLGFTLNISGAGRSKPRVPVIVQFQD